MFNSTPVFGKYFLTSLFASFQVTRLKNTKKPDRNKIFGSGKLQLTKLSVPIRPTVGQLRCVLLQRHRHSGYLTSGRDQSLQIASWPDFKTPHDHVQTPQLNRVVTVLIIINVNERDGLVEDTPC